MMVKSLVDLRHEFEKLSTKELKLISKGKGVKAKIALHVLKNEKIGKQARKEYEKEKRETGPLGIKKFHLGGGVYV